MPIASQLEERANTEELFREYKEDGSPEKREEIVKNHLFLAEILARKYIGRGVEFEDLFQVASYGLVLSVDRFDPDKGVLFTSFATPTIIGEIKKHFRDTTWSLKVPRRLKEISLRIIETKEELQDSLHHVPTVQELAEHLEVSEEEIIEALESGRAHTTFSLEQEMNEQSENDSMSLEKYLGDEEEGYGRLETSAIFEKVVAELSPTEKEVMRKRFLQEVTQREVAELLGLSQMTVSRIERAMRNKFRMEYDNN